MLFRAGFLQKLTFIDNRSVRPFFLYTHVWDWRAVQRGDMAHLFNANVIEKRWGQQGIGVTRVGLITDQISVEKHGCKCIDYECSEILSTSGQSCQSHKQQHPYPGALSFSDNIMIMGDLTLSALPTAGILAFTQLVSIPLLEITLPEGV